MQKHKGFTLIEMLMYLALVALVALLSAQAIIRLWTTCMTYEKKRISLINITAAHDTLVRDISGAYSKTSYWKIRELSRLIWHTKEHDVCWMQDKDTLVRIEGIYNESKQQWHKKTKNLVIPSIKKVQFRWHDNGDEMSYIDISLTDALNTIDTRIMLMQRLLYERKI